MAPNPSGPAQATPRVGRFGYIADMVRQLEIMAGKMSCRALAALLELARQEALV